MTHPASSALLAYFATEHLPPRLAGVAQPCAELAEMMARELPDGPELTAGLRKLLEAKDCFVRSVLTPAPDTAP